MIAENVQVVRQKIADICKHCGRDPREITLIAVSKTFDSERILEVVNSGILDIGENYVQEFQAKQQQLINNNIRWHFIGHLQRNKVKYIIENVEVIQSVDSLRLGEEISKQAEKYNKEIQVMVEVNTSGEESKFGVHPDKAVSFTKELRQIPRLNIIGFMTIGPLTENAEDSRPAFARLRNIQQELQTENFRVPHLSMGMSNDYRIAIEEGATMIRLGTSIFGKRTYLN